MSKALPYIAAAGTFLATGSFQAAQAAFVITSLAVNALDPPKKPGAAERQASVTTLSLGEQSRELLIGETCTAGTLVDAFNFGGKYGTDTVTRCIAVADHAIDGVVGYYIGDQYYPWTVDGIQPGFSNKLSIRFYNATADGHAPKAHVLAAGWSASDRLAGMAVFWVDTQYDEKVWPQGHPQLKFVLRGLRAYDMRFDPAFGYTGPNPQTWENRASHVHTRNAAILRYAFTRGIYTEGHQGDPDYLLIGRGLSAEEAPPERIIAAANLCDEVVDGGPRYTANGVIRASDAFITVEEMFSAAMAGQIVQREGGVEVEPGQAKAAVVTITDGALVVGEPVSFSAFLPDTDGGRINSVLPRYVSPAQNWRDFAGPVRRDVADIAADGGPREATLSLLLVTDGAQADRCAEIMRKAARLERRATIVLPPEYANLEEGDWIAWRSDRYHHGATVRYRIESWTLDEKWRMRLSLREIASSVFGVPDPVEDAAPPPPPPPVPVDALILDGVTAVRFTWDTPVDAAVLAIRAEVRRAGGTEIATGRADDISLGAMVMSNGVPADAAIEARLVPIGDPSRPVLASAWVPLSTTSLVAGDVSATGPTIAAINDDITDLLDSVGDVSGALTTAVADLEAADAALQDRLADAEVLVGDVNVALLAADAALEASLADVDERLDVAIGDISGVVAVNETQQTAIDGKAEFSDLEAVRLRVDGAELDIIDLVEADATETAARVAQTSELSARIEVRRNSLVNGGFEFGAEGLSATHTSPLGVVTTLAMAAFDDPAWGRLLDLQTNGPGTYEVEWPPQPAVSFPGYVITGDTALLGIGADGYSYFDQLFQGPAGQDLGPTGDGNQSLVVGPTGFSTNGQNRRAYAVSSDAPAGTGRYVARFILLATSSPTVIRLRQVKCEVGGLPATPYTADASSYEMSGQIAEQQLILVDLDAGKVDVSDYEVLEAEVTGARDGQPTLGGAISHLKSVQIEDNTARVDDIVNLSARSDDTEAAVLDLDQAIVDEAGARATAIDLVRAGARSRFNHLVNGSGEAGTTGITAHNTYGGVTTTLDLATLEGTWGPVIDVGVYGPGTYSIEWEPVPTAPGLVWTVTGDTALLGIGPSDISYFDVIFTDGAGAAVPGGDGGQNPIAGPHDFSTTGANRDAYAVASVAPAGAAKVNARLIISVASLNPSVVRIRQVKLEQGSLPATAYSRDARDLALGASVDVIRQAQIDETEIRALQVEALSVQADGLSGDIGALNEAVIDLEANTVNLTSFETLEGEVITARDGQPSLSGKLSSLRTLQIDGDSVLSESIGLIEARTGATEADIADLDTALSTESLSRADAINAVRARLAVNQNLMPNGSGEKDTEGWAGPGVEAIDWAPYGGRCIKFALGTGNYSGSYLTSPRAKVQQAETVTLQWRSFLEGSFSGSLQIYMAFADVSGGYLGETPRKAFTATDRTITATTPTGCRQAFLVVYVEGTATGTNLILSQIKIEDGPVATVYSNDATAQTIAASVAGHTSALVDLELNKAEASDLLSTQAQIDDVSAQTLILQESTADLAERIGDAKITIAAAVGDTPALMQLRDNRDGSLIALIAQRLLFGNYDGTTVVEAMRLISGEVFFSRPIYIDLGTKRLIVGPGNGWVLWFGGQDKTAATATRINGKFALGDDGEVYLGAELLGGGAFTVKAPLAIQRTVVGGTGTITTAPLAVVTSGATGTIDWTWTNVFGDKDVAVGGSSTPTFSANPVGVSRMQAIFTYAAHDSGTGVTRNGQVAVTIQREA